VKVFRDAPKPGALYEMRARLHSIRELLVPVLAAIVFGIATPHYLLRDRDGAYGAVFRKRLFAMGTRERPVAPRSPWQNGYVARVIGSIRRDHGHAETRWTAPCLCVDVNSGRDSMNSCINFKSDEIQRT